MKLLTKTTLYFLLAMVPLLIGGGYLLFQQFAAQLNEQADKELVYEEVQWIQYLELATSNGSSFVLRAPDLLILPVEKEPAAFPDLTTVQGQKAREKVEIPFRQLNHVVDVNGQRYQLVIRKSQEQKLALVANITSIMLVVFAGLFGATLLFNWIISKRIWQPFRSTLQTIRNIDLEKLPAVRFGETSIEEFNELNASLNTMVNKIQSDYISMKEFTENAAHEMQTPLAVAQTKLELLLQDPALKEAQIEAIAQTSTALGRLSKLNGALLLLAKIENNQFEAEGTIDLVPVLKKYLALFEEFIREKRLTVDADFAAGFDIRLHPFLADSLVSNLLGNAIKYNRDSGRITLHSSNDAFCIGNTSELPAIERPQLFQRFKTARQATGTGLGLAIVKKIIDASGCVILYSHDADSHSFCINRVKR